MRTGLALLVLSLAACSKAPEAPTAGIVVLEDFYDVDKSAEWAESVKSMEELRLKVQQEIAELELQYQEQKPDPRDPEHYMKRVDAMKKLEVAIQKKGEEGKIILMGRAAELQAAYLQKSIEPAIAAVAAELKLDVVYRIGKPPAGVDPALYKNPGEVQGRDITSQVLKRINRK